jgi:hypothetical protein
MNTFVLALASIAVVLVNLGIGWTLARYYSRLPEPKRPQPLPPDNQRIGERPAAEATPDEAPTGDLDDEPLEPAVAASVAVESPDAAATT